MLTNVVIWTNMNAEICINIVNNIPVIILDPLAAPQTIRRPHRCPVSYTTVGDILDKGRFPGKISFYMNKHNIGI